MLLSCCSAATSHPYHPYQSVAQKQQLLFDRRHARTASSSTTSYKTWQPCLGCSSCCSKQAGSQQRVQRCSAGLTGFWTAVGAETGRCSPVWALSSSCWACRMHSTRWGLLRWQW